VQWEDRDAKRTWEKPDAVTKWLGGMDAFDAWKELRVECILAEREYEYKLDSGGYSQFEVKFDGRMETSWLSAERVRESPGGADALCAW
jgi:hypothetical protein